MEGAVGPFILFYFHMITPRRGLRLKIAQAHMFVAHFITVHFWPTRGTTLNHQFDGALPGFEPTVIYDYTSQMSKTCLVELGAMCDIMNSVSSNIYSFQIMGGWHLKIQQKRTLIFRIELAELVISNDRAEKSDRTIS